MTYQEVKDFFKNKKIKIKESYRKNFFWIECPNGKHIEVEDDELFNRINIINVNYSTYKTYALRYLTKQKLEEILKMGDFK